MYYTEFTLIALILVVLFMRPEMISGFARTGLGKLMLVVGVLLVAKYTNRNAGILAAILAITLIHMAHNGLIIEGMDTDVPPPVSTDVPPPVSTDVPPPVSTNVPPPVSTDDDNTNNNDSENKKKSNEKLSKMDLECISRALRSCSSNELPVNRDSAGATQQAPVGAISVTGKGTEGFYS